MTTWREFYTAFTKKLIGEDSLSDLWNRMSNRVQTKGENINTYFHENLKLCGEVSMHFEDAREQILIGLCSKELRNNVAPRNHVDDDDLLHDLLKQQRIIEQSYERRSTRIDPANNKRPSVTGNPVKSDTRLTERSDEKPAQNELASRRAPARNDKGEPKCFTCNRYGHMSKDCPDKVLTKQPNPFNNAVKERSDENKTGTMRTVEGIAAHAANKYFKEATLEGHVVKAFVDAGSSECTVTATTVLMYDLPLVREAMLLRSFGPQEFKVNSLGYVRGRLIIDDVKVDDVPVRLVPDDCQPVAMIIGRSFTEQPHVRYIKEKDSLRFEYAHDEIMNIEVNVTDAVTVSKDVELPPGTMNFISVHDSKNDYSLPILNFSE